MLLSVGCGFQVCCLRFVPQMLGIPSAEHAMFSTRFICTISERALALGLADSISGLVLGGLAAFLGNGIR